MTKDVIKIYSNYICNTPARKIPKLTELPPFSYRIPPSQDLPYPSAVFPFPFLRIFGKVIKGGGESLNYAMLFEFHNMAFKNLQLEVANKKPLSTQVLSLHKLKFPVKKTFFMTAKCCLLGCYTSNILLAVSKII